MHSVSFNGGLAVTLPKPPDGRRLGATVAMVAGLTLAFVAPANAAPPAAKTIVSLTFDDAHASQQFAFDTMKQYGMLGTFYMNSGFIGANGFLTLDQAKDIAAYGNEIGSAHRVASRPGDDFR